MNFLSYTSKNIEFKIDRINRVKMSFKHFSVRKSVKFQEVMLFFKIFGKSDEYTNFLPIKLGFCD